MIKSHLDKKVLVAAAGAVGSFFGSLLAKNGFDVTFLARSKRLKQLREKGLYIKSTVYGEFSISTNIVETSNLIYDIIIIAVKSHQTEEMCKTLIPCITDNTIVFSLQNGIDNYLVLKNYFEKDNIVLSALSTCLNIDPDGTVVHTFEGPLKIGSYFKTAEASVNVISDILNVAHIPHKIVDDIKQSQWEKLLWNIAFNPMSTILEVTCGKMISDNGIRDNMLQLMYEVKEAAYKDGIILNDERIYKTLSISEKAHNFKTSMLQDIQSLKKPEIDGILLPIIKRLKEDSQKFTFSEFIYNIINFKYGRPFIYTPKLAVDVILYNNQMEVLLIERKNPPYGWAIPGGFVDYNETVENAAKREILEETNIVIDQINLLGIYSDPFRDVRGHTVSIVYYTKTDKTPKASDDAINAIFFSIKDIPHLAFDHNIILKDFKEKLSL